ncbi:YrzQ family protein [Bacillus benzoevorans]
MNKTLTSMLTLGAGFVAYNYLQKNNVISNRNMRRLKKGIKSMF